MLKKLLTTAILTGFLIFTTELRADPEVVDDIISLLTLEELDCLLNSSYLEDENGISSSRDKFCCRTGEGRDERVEEITDCGQCYRCIKHAACMTCCNRNCKNKTDREGCRLDCSSG